MFVGGMAYNMTIVITMWLYKFNLVDRSLFFTFIQECCNSTTLCLFLYCMGSYFPVIVRFINTLIKIFQGHRMIEALKFMSNGLASSIHVMIYDIYFINPLSTHYMDPRVQKLSYILKSSNYRVNHGNKNILIQTLYLIIKLYKLQVTSLNDLIVQYII